MAQLERIILKHSVEESLADFEAALTGELSTSGGDIEAGEVVLRRGSGFVELWTLDADLSPQQLSIDIGGVVPPWDPSELARGTLGQLSDVSYTDGIVGGLGTAQAGYVLTWDGLRWVVRPQLALEELEGAIPSLNDVGDVNYAFYATASNPKFSPDLGDVLIWDYNPTLAKYQWAPTALAFENLQFVNVFSGTVNLNRAQFGRLQFGLDGGGTQQAGIFGSAGAVGMSIGLQELRFSGEGRQTGSGTQTQGHATLKLRNYLELDATHSGATPAIRWKAEAHPLSLPSDLYIPSLRHVREDFGTRKIGDLGDVDDTGVQNGYVLAWNASAQRYEPSVGPAPDLSAASINELQDVNTTGRSRGLPLAWDPVQVAWTPQSVLLTDLKFDSFDFFYLSTDPSNHTTRCRECNAANVGRVTVVGNVPYVCLRTRSTATRTTGNDRFGYVRLLHDGYSRLQNTGDPYPTDENRQAVSFRPRTDPLSVAAYEGTLGSLYNVSTANVFPGASPVYNPSTLLFEMGYPALDLASYSIGQLGDVDATGAGAGYGLLWNGSAWVASSLDQRFRLDDMQDVQFGDLGVTNNRLVAAYQLIANPELPEYTAGADVSTVLAVSTAKGDAQLGSTREFNSPTGQFYSKARYWAVETNWTLAQKLDNYVRWGHEPSWQTIDGDGCIEVWFYCTLLLEDRCIFRKVATAGFGGYILRLKQNGGLEWSVTPPTGQSGFFLSSAINSVSLNTWHHVAVTKEGLTHRLYMDGFLLSQTTANCNYTGNGTLALGRNDLDDNNTLTHNFWRGYMLDLRVTRGRPKYTGATYTVPFSIGDEVLDTRPGAGDFLSYDGTKWTNVSGVTADITGNSINELADVDTTSNNPGTGDALVWTGTRWEPGIPGIGSTWGLDDFTDVTTSYASGTPFIRFEQADLLTFSTLSQTPGDLPYILSRQTNGLRLAYFDNSYTCGTGGNGPYADSATVYFDANREGKAEIRAVRATVRNVFYDCTIVGFEYHEDTLHYQKCPDRSYTSPANPYGDIPLNPEETYIPCWGVIQDHMDDLLPYGALGQLGNVSSTQPTLGQALAWDGNQWAPSSSIAADISNNGIGDLADVLLPINPGDIPTGNVLQWNGSQWTNAEKLGSLVDFATVDDFQLTSTQPIASSRTLSGDTPAQGGGVSANQVLDIAGPLVGSYGGRGLAFMAVKNSNGSRTYRKAYIYGGAGTHAPTIVTSGISGTSGSWLEIGDTQIRVADGGATTNGTGGFSLSGRWRFRYEDGALDWLDFTNDQVPSKRGIITYVSAGLADLDLSPNILDDLGNVNTAGKAQGYTLIWDGAQWIASDSVAADISQSSIGGLVDVVKAENSGSTTNDGTISFDVGRLLTSRPRQAGAGVDLASSNGQGLIGWSASNPGAPFLLNTAGPFDDASLAVNPDQVDVQAANGVVVAYQPSLGDRTLPTWLQVRQQIAREAVDYQALFLLGCDDLQEKAYNWPLQVGITTIPNPVYESRFAGSYSLRFQRVNQDRIQWRAADGCPEIWAASLIWSLEFFVKIDSTTAGDGLNEYVVSPVTRSGSSERNSAGLHVYLVGGERNRVAVNFGTKDSQVVGTHNLSGTVPYNSWAHVYLAHEGGNNVRLYLNGQLVGSYLQTSAWNWTGGLSIGGRTQPTAGDDNSYLSAQLDDLRITRGWLPYGENTNSVPVPVEPLPAGDVRFVFGNLSMLEDVNTLLEPPIQGSALIYDAVAGYWKPGIGPAADVSQSSIGQLVDVTTDNSVPDQSDILAWNAATADWRRTKIDGNGGVRPLIARTVTPGQVPSAGNLFAGELYLNMADRKLYALDATGTAFTFATDSTLAEIDEIDGGTY